MSTSIIPRLSRFSNIYCQGEIVSLHPNDMKYDVLVQGVFKDIPLNGEVRYIASNPANRRSSYAGSGFPFHSSQQAFQDTPNKGMIKLDANSFKIPLLFPNSFYVELGNKLIPPSLFLKYVNLGGEEKVITIKLGNPIPYRFLGYPREFTMARNGADFYHAHHNLPVRTQEQVLRDSAYPATNNMDEDFWGLRPAL
jgi:hypothetical protein